MIRKIFNRKMANRKRCDPALKEYENKAEEILSLASSLPKSYQEKVLTDLMRMKEEKNEPKAKPNKELEKVKSLRRSSRTPVKTEKLLALELPQKQCSKARKRQCDDRMDEEETKKAVEKNERLPLPESKKPKRRRKKMTVFLTVSDEEEVDPVPVLPRESEPECTEKGLNVSTLENSYSTRQDKIFKEMPERKDSQEILKVKKENTENDVTCYSEISDKGIAEICDKDMTEISDKGMAEISDKNMAVSSSTELSFIPSETVKPGEPSNIEQAIPKYSNIMIADDFDNVEVPVVSNKLDINSPPSSNIQEEDLAAVKSEESSQPNTESSNIEELNALQIPKRRRKPKNGSTVDCHYCPECNEPWPTRDLLRVHLLSHRKPCKCEFCGQKFRYQHAYEKHVNLHKSGDIVKCPHCANVIIGKDRLEKHIQERHVQQLNIKKKYHPCPQCSESFRSMQKLISHQQEVHGKSLNQCPFCGRRFHYQDRFDRHLKEHQDGVLTQCEYNSCIFHYKTQEEHETHIARTHKKDAARPHMCHICSQSFTEARYLKAHLKVHKKDKKFVCENCMFEAQTMQALKKHLEQKHSMTLAHVCDICGTRLASKLGLQDHLKRHYNQKDYVCDICSKAFVAKCQLVSHRKTHQPPQHVCNVCEKAFINKYKLASHMLTHSQVKQFQCSECSFKCNLKSNLYKHMERLHRLQHPDKFSRYKYVQKVDNATVGNEMGSLEIVDTCDKMAPSESIISESIVELRSNDSILQNGGYEVTEQTEAAEVLAQMQSGHTLVKLEQPEHLQIVSEIASHHHEEIVLEEPPKTEDDEQVIIDHVLHVEEEDGQPDETMYILQLEGTNDTLTLNAKDLETLTSTMSTGANVIAVDSGTVLLDDSGSVVKIVS